MPITHNCTCIVFAFLFAISSTAFAEAVPKELLGDWSLKMESKTPAWMRVAENDGKPEVFIRFYIGPIGPYKNVIVKDGRLHFEIRRKKKGKQTVTKVDVGMKDGKLGGNVVRELPDGKLERDTFTGEKIPPMPKQAPDLSNLKFGETITLFNKKDLTGWKPHEPNKINGWSVKDGLLVNTTPKTDFSATGAHANLKTKANFENFKLHIEFLIGKDRNSGIYLQGMYEAQVVDRDSRMQGKQGVGAIFGAIAPSMNAGKPGGEWQTYDIVLLNRHVTVVLNGKKVIDNQPISAPTAGAIHTNPAKPGPIYLQGDHTSVAYRNIILTPIVKE